jgi:hypothetical protein
MSKPKPTPDPKVEQVAQLYVTEFERLEQELRVYKRAVEIYEADVRTARFRFRHYLETARREEENE